MGFGSGKRGGETGERKWRENHSQDIIFERRINKRGDNRFFFFL